VPLGFRPRNFVSRPPKRPSQRHHRPFNQEPVRLLCALLRLMITTIQVSQATRGRLAALKSTPRESYDELIDKLLTLIPSGDKEGSYTDLFRMGRLNARLDARARRTLDHDGLKGRMGL